MSSTDKLGQGPAGTESPEEYTSNDLSAHVSDDTGTAYDATGEPERTPHDDVLAAEAAAQANPNSASSTGLEGDLGLSSERTGPADETGSAGVELTGTVGSARSSTHGSTPTTGGPELPQSDESENPAEVPAHELGNKNPGHAGS